MAQDKKYLLIRKIFSDCNIHLDSDWRRRMNTVLHNDGSETLKHFIVKASICKMIRDQKRDYVSEVNIGTGTADVMDIELRRVFEIETSPSDTIHDEKVEKYGVGDELDVYIIDTSELSDDIDEIYRTIYDRFFTMFE